MRVITKFKSNKNFLEELTDLRLKKQIFLFFEKKITPFTVYLEQLSKDFEHYAKKEERIYKDFRDRTNYVIAEGEKVIKYAQNRLIAKQIKQHFRDVMRPWFYNETLIQRGYEKPYGYPGDFHIIEKFYNNFLEAKGLKKLCDRYMLEQDYVQAVRDRKEHMKLILQKYIKKNKKRPLTILNLGSGSCRELRELKPNLFKEISSLQITLLDQERRALDFSKNELTRLHPGVHFKFVATNVLNYARHPIEFKKNLGEQDLIYCIGLADYIPDACLGGLIATSFALLKPKGTLVVAHKNVRLHRSLASDWFCDWNFIPRNKNEYIKLQQNYLKGQHYKSSFKDVELGHVFFSKIEKK